MPTVMVANSPARLMVARYGRTSSGASTMPTKMLAAADVPTGPDTPSDRRSAQPMRMHDPLQHAPVIEQFRQRADHQDQRQRMERQDETCSPAAPYRTAPAHRRDSRTPAACRRWSPSATPQPRRPPSRTATRTDRHVQHDAGNDKLQPQPREQQPRQPPRADGRTVLRQRPGDEGKRDQPEQRLRLQRHARSFFPGLRALR